MTILIDVNMRLEWKEILLEAGFEALHWRDVGPRSAPDDDIIRWAADEGTSSSLKTWIFLRL